MHANAKKIKIQKIWNKYTKICIQFKSGHHQLQSGCLAQQHTTPSAAATLWKLCGSPLLPVNPVLSVTHAGALPLCQKNVPSTWRWFWGRGRSRRGPNLVSAVGEEWDLCRCSRNNGTLSVRRGRVCRRDGAASRLSATVQVVWPRCSSWDAS